MANISDTHSAVSVPPLQVKDCCRISDIAGILDNELFAESRPVSWEEWWTYDGISGPGFWGLINPDWWLCHKGRRQSPVNLEPSRLLFDPNLQPLHVDKHRVGGVLANTGHSVVFAVDNDTRHPVNISGGPLSYRYQFHEIHLHFGLDDRTGSEHTVDGHAFPAERITEHKTEDLAGQRNKKFNMKQKDSPFLQKGEDMKEARRLQIFGFNSQLYNNFTDALQRAQGIVAVSLLLQVGDLSNPELRIFTEQLDKIRYGGQAMEIKRFVVRELLPDTKYYMTYDGSITMPACHETTTWIILNKPIYITKQQLGVSPLFNPLSAEVTLIPYTSYRQKPELTNSVPIDPKIRSYRYGLPFQRGEGKKQRRKTRGGQWEGRKQTRANSVSEANNGQRSIDFLAETSLCRSSDSELLSSDFEPPLLALRQLMQGDKNHPNAPLGNNFRPPQPLHHRPVRTNIDFNIQGPKNCPTMNRDIYYKGMKSCCAARLPREMGKVLLVYARYKSVNDCCCASSSVSHG
ncbi:Putative carbonic anhydrase-like protein 2 [Melipona quadrifasciata]|uniref:Putative carbonic anhydrase-like protein 2 n=1 Tax=Melipona quadrifasciata TaxID=166423 RepID=A0A0N0BHB7_9HYME|nr:Putative carbonic anhydrase-like protein 2 [Melipona quadrifasciata]